jgi:hypothetical protein
LLSSVISAFFGHAPIIFIIHHFFRFCKGNFVTSYATFCTFGSSTEKDVTPPSLITLILPP